MPAKVVGKMNELSKEDAINNLERCLKRCEALDRQLEEMTGRHDIQEEERVTKERDIAIAELKEAKRQYDEACH
ncbi:MAG: hypothetical protein ABSA18_11555 [Dehalococcoidia bacterium]|jgi:crotonobetainyl-CoA:carnitine CoA-transferase CaiB-like acyl-CoA transferase